MRDGNNIKRVAVNFSIAFVLSATVYVTCLFINRAIERNDALNGFIAIFPLIFPFLIFPLFAVLSIQSIRRITSSRAKQVGVIVVFAGFPFVFSAGAIVILLFLGAGRMYGL